MHLVLCLLRQDIDAVPQQVPLVCTPMLCCVNSVTLCVRCETLDSGLPILARSEGLQAVTKMLACLQKQGPLSYCERRVRPNASNTGFLLLPFVSVLLEQNLFVDPLLSTLCNILPLILADLTAGRRRGVFSTASSTDLHSFLRDNFVHSRQTVVPCCSTCRTCWLARETVFAIRCSTQARTIRCFLALLRLQSNQTFVVRRGEGHG